MCDGMESIDHLILLCPMASFIWTVIRELVDWPTNLQSVLDLVSINKHAYVKNFEMVWVGAAAAMWSLWTTRNKLIFEGRLVKKPADIVYRWISFLQLWHPLWDERFRLAIDWVIARRKRGCEDFLVEGVGMKMMSSAILCVSCCYSFLVFFMPCKNLRY
jgi:hypothetical protein